MDIFNDEFLFNKRINTLPFHAHFIPFAKEDKPKYYHGATLKESSSKVTLLNGIWNFKEYKRYQDFNDLDYKFSDKEKLVVPSCVQCYGYDHIQYLNCQYPFPFNPPYIDVDNPLFHYQRTINISNIDERIYIVFEGVDNAFYLFVNNQKVGYSLIAHSKSEFDITKYLKNGENKIDVLVLKWSASSYFECQDKFRFSGIFRDVYLLKRKEKHITDYRFITTIEKGVGYIEFINQSDVDISLSFKNKKYAVFAGKNVKIAVIKPNLWSADNPYLYKFKLEYGDEIIYERIGIRNSYCKDGVYYFNDKHLKFKGVNRHESNPVTGMTVSIKDTFKDLSLMKKLGVNSIRTSHYPDIPEFYEMCDYLGLYVLDEADVETHGASQYLGYYSTETWQEFANKEENVEPIYEREISLFERDKNRTCVVIFSLGNESSYGKMFFKGLDYLKEHSDRPIHYENVWCTIDHESYYEPRLDFASRMYPEPKELKERHFDDPKEWRPIIMCEYSHAMGNSNGDLADYWRLFTSSDRYCGGFIWEWCDHAVLVDGKLHYGGDDNDLPNDSNFCVDGLVTPFRKLKSNTLEMEAVYKGKLYPDAPVDKTSEFVPPLSDKAVKVIADDKNAELKQVYFGDKPVFKDGVKLNYLRADLDNDIPIEQKDSFKRLINASRKIDKITKFNNYIEYEGRLFYEKDLLSFKVRYSFIGNALLVNLSYEKKDETLFLPRFGVKFTLKDDCKDFTFFGYGPDESYVDKHIHNSIGEFKVRVKDNMANILKPQECGSHYYSSYVKANNVYISASKPFSFSILPYSLETLKNTKHNYELPRSNKAYVSLDIAMAGVGTNSCGPRLNKKYWLSNSDSNTLKIYFK